MNLFNERRGILILCLLIISITGKANSIQGKIVDSERNELPYANVILMQMDDSLFKAATLSDSHGTFTFNNVTPGKYLIRVQYIGFQTSDTTVIMSSSSDLQQLMLILYQNNLELEGVTIVSSKPLIEHHLDKTIVNVENSPASSGNTALELLEKSPGVFVDYNSNNISLLNKTGLIVMINGRQNFMSGLDLIQYLRTLQSDQISRIEIITNPSSKYDAAGSAGIINIILKKNQAFGFNGTATLASGRGILSDASDDLFRGTGNFSIHYRSKKWYLFGSASVLRDGFYSENNISRTFQYLDSGSIFNQKMQRPQLALNQRYRIGSEYSLSDKTMIGFSTEYNKSILTLNGTNSTSAFQNIELPVADFSIRQEVVQKSPTLNFNSNVNLQHQFKKKGKSLQADIDFLRYNFHSQQEFDASFFDNMSQFFDNLKQTSVNDSQLSVLASKIDMEEPLNENSSVEYGLKSSYVKINSNLDFQEWIIDNWINDAGRSNHFIYHENINAAYGNYRKQFSKFSVQIGLRAEHTFSSGNSLTLDSIVKRNYVSLFPTFFAKYDIGESNSVRLNYSRRLNRPAYSQLNPFIIVLDPYSYALGNPYLQPQFTHSIQMGYHFKRYSLEIDYSKTNDLITELTIPNDSTRVTRTIQSNLNQLSSLSFNLNAQIDITSFWNIYSQCILYHRKYHDGNLLEGTFNASQWIAYGTINSNFRLPKNWRLEVSGWYQSPFIEGIIIGDNHRYSVNFGVQKSLFQNRARVQLSASDIFLTSFVKGSVDYQNVQLQFQPKFTSRRLMLTFTWNFGSQTVKTNQRRRSASDSEKERINQ